MKNPASISLNKVILAELLSSFAADVLGFYESIRSRPVVPLDLPERIAALVDDALKTEGLGLEGATRILKKDILPGLANTSGPRAFPWVIGGVTPAAFIGALYQILYDQINMVSGASIGPKLETVTIKLLLDLFELPRDIFEGSFTTGATSSNICALATARQWWGEQNGINIAVEGMTDLPPFEIYSASPHASISKALGVLGMGRKSLILTPTLTAREAIDADALEVYLARSTARAKIVVASAGTVNTGDFDDLIRIREICSKYNAWLHVDAAFGLFAKCHAKYKNLIAGIELADSVTADGHKWLNVPYDCGMLFIKSVHKSCQIATFSSVADYMSKAADEPMNKGIENSRALRALPAWVSLKAYGHQGYEKLVEHNCAFAQAVAAMLSESGHYKLLAPVRLNIVLFQGIEISSLEENAKLVQEINKTGKIFITATVYEGKPALRIAVCNWQTSIILDLSVTQEALMEGLSAYRRKAVPLNITPPPLSFFLSQDKQSVELSGSAPKAF